MGSARMISRRLGQLELGGKVIKAANNQNIIIQMREVFKTYSTGDIPFIALNNVNIDVRQGEFLGITGKSGAGKPHSSTLSPGLAS